MRREVFGTLSTKLLGIIPPEAQLANAVLVLEPKTRRKRPQPIAAAGVAFKSHPSGTISKLFRRHVVAEQRVHVANVELAVGDYGVGPSFTSAAIGLVEATMLLIAVWAGIDQRYRALLFRAQVKMSIGVGDASLAHALVAPFDLSREHVHA